MKGACGPLASVSLALPLLVLVLVLVSLVYSLLLLCAAVACSGLPHNREGAPRARDNLATSCFFFQGASFNIYELTPHSR